MKTAKIAVYGALAANIAIAIVKFIAAFVTGSSSMLSEGIHSLVDTVNELLLLLGMRRSRIPPSQLHHFGHSREIYFWALIVSVLIFGIGGGMSVYEGITHINDPHQLKSPLWNYIVLGFSMVFEGSSLFVALHSFKKELKPDKSFFSEFRKSKDPSFFVIIYEDSAALMGLILAAIGVILTHVTGNPFYDGLSSILIGLVLCGVATVLIIESHHLLLGVSASKNIEEKVRTILAEEKSLTCITSLKTTHIGPRNIVLVLKIKDSSLNLINMVRKIRDRVIAEIPDIKSVYFDPE